MSIDLITGKDTKANKWVSRYGHVANRRVTQVDTPEQMIKDSDALILFGKDALLDKLESMALSHNVKVYKFTLY